MKIVLASRSPRRIELLRMIGICDFKILPSDCEEEADTGLTPCETVCAIAQKKASEIARLCEREDLIIAADTLVYLDDMPLGKPESPQDAARMLRLLSGRAHTVMTGLALLRGDTRLTEAAATEVHFRKISDSEIERYVSTGEPLDKAGAYGVQGRGSVFIEKLCGDFFNVVGLPLCRLSVMLREFGVFI